MAEILRMWSVKSVPPAVRDMAVAGAKAQGISVAEWIAQAVAAQAARDMSD